MPPGRSAADNVDDDPQLKCTPDIAQQFEIDVIGIVIGILAIDLVEERGLRSLGTIRDRMQHA